MSTRDGRASWMPVISVECSRCGHTLPSSNDVFWTVCPKCQGALLLRYDLKQIGDLTPRSVFEARDDTFWKFIEFLPIQPENAVSLGEPYTPILRLPTRLGKSLRNVYLKDDGRLPTGTFKARGMAVLVSKLKELSMTKRVAIPSAGNAAAALAAYASRIGLSVFVFMPSTVPETNLRECVYLGADVELVDGSISDAAEALKQRQQKSDWVVVSTNKQPYRFEGYKAGAFELAEQFSWNMPDSIIFPTGGGEGVIGLWKGFNEMRALGWIEKIPRLTIVQSAGCAPLVKAFENEKTEVEEPWKHPTTVATGLRVPYPYASDLVLRIIDDTKGQAIAVEDDAIVLAMKTLFNTGIYACPEAASTLAALTELKAQGNYDSAEKTLLYLTGTAFKYSHIMKVQYDLVRRTYDA
jgi:threonine synthase